MRRQVSSGQVHGFDWSVVFMMFPSAVVLEAVDREGLSGDEAGLRRSEEYDNLGDVVWLAQPSQRDVLCGDLAATAARDGVAKLGLDQARTNRIDEDRRTELLRQRAR